MKAENCKVGTKVIVKERSTAVANFRGKEGVILGPSGWCAGDFDIEFDLNGGKATQVLSPHELRFANKEPKKIPAPTYNVDDYKVGTKVKVVKPEGIRIVGKNDIGEIFTITRICSWGSEFHLEVKHPKLGTWFYRPKEIEIITNTVEQLAIKETPPKFKIGDKVIVLPNAEELQRLNERVGWAAGMEKSIGKYFIVKDISDLGSYQLSNNYYYVEESLKLVRDPIVPPIKTNNQSEPTIKYKHIRPDKQSQYGGGITIAYYRDSTHLVFGMSSCASKVAYNKKIGRELALKQLTEHPQRVSIDALIGIFDPGVFGGVWNRHTVSAGELLEGLLKC